jgi:hypothetical protein
VFAYLLARQIATKQKPLGLLLVLCYPTTGRSASTRSHHFQILAQVPISIERKGGIKVRRFIVATSDSYRAELLGLV